MVQENLFSTDFYLVEVTLLCLQELCKKSLSLISSNL